MRYLAFLALLLTAHLYGESLDPEYLITYGNQDAKEQIIEYFSFACPHCSRLFVEDFPVIKTDYLDSGRAHWIFHPIPVDVATVQAMACLRRLPNDKKQIFLEEILAEAAQPNPLEPAMLMEKVMAIFEEAVVELDDKEALASDPAFLAAFEFLKKEGVVEAVPTVAINGRLMLEDVPSQKFIAQMLEGEKS